MLRMRKASETVVLLWSCLDLPSRHAGANQGQAQGTGPSWCVNNIPATLSTICSFSESPAVCQHSPLGLQV